MNDERNKTLEELYSNYYDSVYRFCMTVTGFDRRYYHLIEDCVQDAFIAAILKYDDFKHYNNPIGWIARVASNRLKSEIRKDRNRRKTISSRMQIRSEDVAFFGNCVEQEIEREELKQDTNHSPIAYTCGVYGWNFDVYEIEGLTICTGYRGMPGRRANNIIEYEAKARLIMEEYSKPYEERTAAVEKLLHEWIAQA